MVEFSLHEYFLSSSEKSLHKWIHYFDIYEKHFARFRGRSPRVLEIGVFQGGSLKMWQKYFGPGSLIVGLDINPDCAAFAEPGIHVEIGSQSDRAVLARLVDRYGTFDVVIDDGSHVMADMKASFDFLYPRINANGVYLVEDTHTCYWEEYGGGLRQADSFTEYAKAHIDDLNAVHTRGALGISDLTRSTMSVSFYDSIIVYERRPQKARHVILSEPL